MPTAQELDTDTSPVESFGTDVVINNCLVINVISFNPSNSLSKDTIPTKSYTKESTLVGTESTIVSVPARATTSACIKLAIDQRHSCIEVATPASAGENKDFEVADYTPTQSKSNSSLVREFVAVVLILAIIVLGVLGAIAYAQCPFGASRFRARCH